ncbi:MAG: hypothetical protein ABIQ65_20870, partial [Thermoanaerobaculia bacterium]
GPLGYRIERRGPKGMARTLWGCSSMIAQPLWVVVASIAAWVYVHVYYFSLRKRESVELSTSWSLQRRAVGGEVRPSHFLVTVLLPGLGGFLLGDKVPGAILSIFHLYFVLVGLVSAPGPAKTAALVMIWVNLYSALVRLVTLQKGMQGARQANVFALAHKRTPEKEGH